MTTVDLVWFNAGGGHRAGLVQRLARPWIDRRGGANSAWMKTRRPDRFSEAVQQGLPVIVTRNASTMPQERWNATWVQEMGLGVVHRSFGTVRHAVTEITARLPEFKTAARCIDNRAVFEIPAILAGILAASGVPTPGQQTCEPVSSA